MVKGGFVSPTIGMWVVMEKEKRAQGVKNTKKKIIFFHFSFHNPFSPISSLRPSFNPLSRFISTILSLPFFTLPLLMRREGRRHFIVMVATQYFFSSFLCTRCMTFSAYNVQKINYTNQCIAFTILNFQRVPLKESYSTFASQNH